MPTGLGSDAGAEAAAGRAPAAAIAAGAWAPFTPPIPYRRAQKPDLFSALRAFYVNPLHVWPDTLFDAPHQVNRVAGKAFVAVADPGLTRQVLLDEAACFGRSAVTARLVGPALRNGLLTADGAAWRRQRRLAAPSFRQVEINGYAPAMAAAGARAGERLLARARDDGGVVDVMDETIRATFDVVMETLFDGADPPLDRETAAADIGAFIETMGRIDPFDLFGAPSWLPKPWKASGLAAVERFRASALAVVRAKRARLDALGLAVDPAALGLTDRLIRAADAPPSALQPADPEPGAERLTDDEVVDNVMTFISAGHETTSLALTWTLYLLALSPALQDAVAEQAPDVSAADPAAAPLIEQVIKEAMRLFPPAAATARSVTAPVRLGDLDLRPGDHVTLAIYVTHRHRKVWRDPELFDPARFAPDAPPIERFAYLPFGGGPHICIGMSFALMEARLMLAEILSRVRVRLAREAPPEPVLRMTLRPKGGMPLRISAR